MRSRGLASATYRKAAASGPSLTVDEHLRLAASTAHRGVWTVERIYDLFPRLAERRGNGGFQLSGGEQQMLAIGRALLFNPRLLVMDEPTEGLAPVIVEQVATTLKSLGDDALSVLLVEQNLGVAIDVADTIAVMVNGRIARTLPAAELAADRDLQQRLLGVTTGAEVEEVAPALMGEDELAPEETRIYTIRRAGDEPASTTEGPSATTAAEERTVRGFTRWNAADTQIGPRDRVIADRAEPPAAVPSLEVAAANLSRAGREARVVELPVAETFGRAAYVAGTFDTKGRELGFLRNCLEKLGLRTVTVDLSTSGAPSPASVRAARGGAPSSRRRTGGLHGRSWIGGDRDGGGVRAIRNDAARSRRADLGRRLGRNGAGDGGDAPASDRHPEGDGFDRGLGRRETLRRPIGHLHDVLGDRRVGHQQRFRESPVQCRPCPGRHDCPCRTHGVDVGGEACHRALDVRCHDALRAGHHQATRRSLRLPGVPCHGNRRPVDGEAGRDQACWRA